MNHVTVSNSERQSARRAQQQKHHRHSHG